MTSPRQYAEMRLLMPFVVCASEGGPYDDAAFAAGYELGLLDAALSKLPVEYSTALRTASMPQADLIAMRHNFTTESKVWSLNSEWTLVTFTRTAPS